MSNKKYTSPLNQTLINFKSILDSVPDAIVIVNEEGKIVFINEQTEILFGYKSEELLNSSVEKLIPQRFRKKHIKQRKDFVSKPYVRSMGQGIELFGIKKNNDEFPVEISLSPLETFGGRFIISSIRDVTLQKQTAEKLSEINEELKLHTEQLEKSNMELKQFAYIVSHDLQAPLRSIAGFVQLLKQSYKGQLDEQADDWINRTVKNTKKMQVIIQDILTYSRIDSRAMPFQIIDLNETVNEVISMMESSINDSAAVITKDRLPAVKGDPSQLVQLLQNLIGNAIKYQGKETPKVHISTEKNEGSYIISVSDNGIGIDPKYHNQVFEIFKRLHTQSEYPGTGIGLAICRRIVERHGGRIWIESEPGRGSKFSFTVNQITEGGD